MEKEKIMLALPMPKHIEVLRKMKLGLIKNPTKNLHGTYDRKKKILRIRDRKKVIFKVKLNEKAGDNENEYFNFLEYDGESYEVNLFRQLFMNLTDEENDLEPFRLSLYLNVDDIPTDDIFSIRLEVIEKSQRKWRKMFRNLLSKNRDANKETDSEHDKNEFELDNWWKSAGFYTKESTFNMFAPFDGTIGEVLTEADIQWSQLNLNEKNEIYLKHKK